VNLGSANKMMKKRDMDEAERIYNAIFRAKIPRSLKSRFQEAVGRVSDQYTESERKEYNFALASITDLEALELAARQHKRLPLLVARIRLMVRLGETLPENRKYFLITKHRKLVWPWVLKLMGIRTLMKYIKGRFLLRSVKNA